MPPETPSICRSPVKFGAERVLFDSVCVPVRLAIDVVSTEIVIPLDPVKSVAPLLERPAPIVRAPAKAPAVRVLWFAQSIPVPVEIKT